MNKTSILKADVDAHHGDFLAEKLINQFQICVEGTIDYTSEEGVTLVRNTNRLAPVSTSAMAQDQTSVMYLGYKWPDQDDYYFNNNKSLAHILEGDALIGLELHEGVKIREYAGTDYTNASGTKVGALAPAINWSVVAKGTPLFITDNGQFTTNSTNRVARAQFLEYKRDWVTLEVTKPKRPVLAGEKMDYGFMLLTVVPDPTTPGWYDHYAQYDYLAFPIGVHEGFPADFNAQLRSRNPNIKFGAYFHLFFTNPYMETAYNSELPIDGNSSYPARYWNIVKDYWVYEVDGVTKVHELGANNWVWNFTDDAARALIVSLFSEYVNEYGLNWLFLDYIQTPMVAPAQVGDFDGDGVSYGNSASEQAFVLSKWDEYMLELKQAMPGVVLLTNGNGAQLNDNIATEVDGCIFENFAQYHFGETGDSPRNAMRYGEELSLWGYSRNRYKRKPGILMLEHHSNNHHNELLSYFFEGCVSLQFADPVAYNDAVFPALGQIVGLYGRALSDPVWEKDDPYHKIIKRRFEAGVLVLTYNYGSITVTLE